MSQFTSNFKGELVGKNLWKNLEVFEYHVGTYPSDEIITVPEGYVTDFASVPRFLWPLIAPIDRHAKASIIHDYCYDHMNYSRKRADEIFKEALEILKINPIKIWFMYNVVNWFGWNRWNKAKKESL